MSILFVGMFEHSISIFVSSCFSQFTSYYHNSKTSTMVATNFHTLQQILWIEGNVSWNSKPSYPRIQCKSYTSKNHSFNYFKRQSISKIQSFWFRRRKFSSKFVVTRWTCNHLARHAHEWLDHVCDNLARHAHVWIC